MGGRVAGQLLNLMIAQAQLEPIKIWKLKKPSYGLKDASKRWFDSTTKTLLGLGMKQCMRDCCVFYYHKNGELSGLLVFHVDDFLSSGDEDFKKRHNIAPEEKVPIRENKQQKVHIYWLEYIPE